MKISIAVPSRDYARYLDSCLASIKAQYDSDFEVLIADGGSVDESLEIARRHEAADPRFRIVSTADAGQADAVQRAFAESTGEIFGFLNADDCYVRHDALALVRRAFAENPQAGLVSFGGCYIREDGSRIGPVRLRYHPLDGSHLMRYRTAVLQPATFWRREVQEAVPFRTDLHFVFDAWFFYEAFCRFRWLEVPDEIAGYRLHGSNKSCGVKADRIAELAKLERRKFGDGSIRAAYLEAVSSVAGILDRLPAGGGMAKRGLRLGVNGASYLAAYRIPGI